MREKKKTLAFPTSDISPGTESLSAQEKMDKSSEEETPTVKSKFPVGHLGHRTAEDGLSTNRTPNPFGV